MKLAFPVLALFLIAACTAGASSSVAGTYTVDTKALIAAIPAADQETAKKNGMDIGKMMSDMFETMTIELAADGTATAKSKDMQGKPQEEKGTWKLDGDKITITTKDKDTGKDETKSGTFKSGTITVAINEPNSPVKQLILRKK